MSTVMARIGSLLEGKDPKTLQAVVGFDGYIDELDRVVQSVAADGSCTFFPTISSFAQRLAEAAGKSADIETVSTEVKLGGNAPILANALTQLGVDTTCIGAMGSPELRDVFQEMAKTCRCISLCNPAYTNALEFDDGKIMLANAKPLEGLNWTRVKEVVGLERVIALFESCTLAAMVNWGGVIGSEDIWSGIRQEVLPRLEKKERLFFFDLADPSKRTAEQICGVLEQIRSFSPFGRVILGMNENEALRVSAAAGGPADTPERAAKALYDRLQIDALVVHPIDRCIGVTCDGAVTEYGHVVAKPVISTGGGDNFNAGFCLGLMLGCRLQDAMIMGMATSGYYVGNGHSPTLEQLLQQLKDF